jgi:hypothetical protein
MDEPASRALKNRSSKSESELEAKEFVKGKAAASVACFLLARGLVNLHHGSGATEEF